MIKISVVSTRTKSKSDAEAILEAMHKQSDDIDVPVDSPQFKFLPMLEAENQESTANNKDTSPHRSPSRGIQIVFQA